MIRIQRRSSVTHAAALALSVLARLRQAGTAVLLVEQLIDQAVTLADRVCALARGHVVLEATASKPGLHARLEHAYMGTAGEVAS